MGTTVAITGGTGYIAGFITAEFLNHGYEVRVSIRDPAKMDRLIQGLDGWVEQDSLSRLTGFTADLTSPDGWAQGFEGADGVIHVASPLGHNTESASQLTAVAKGGVLNVLEAAKNAGVERVVMTSSGGACTPRSSVGAVQLDETFWSDPDNRELSSYRVSKIHAEKAAWAFAQDRGIRLTTILPGSVFGPLMRKGVISSNEILRRLLDKEVPAAARVPLDITDVRDLAALHRLGFENDAAIGERFLATGPSMSLPQITALFLEHFPQTNTPEGMVPNWVVRVAAVFIPSLRQIVPMLDRRYTHTTGKAESLLGWTQRPPQETVLDAAQSLIDFGLVPLKAAQR